jgi:hypothetical protein
VFFRRLVAAAAERGELSPDVDVRAVEDLLNAVVSGSPGCPAITGDARRHAAAVDALQRFFAGTLLVDGPPPRLDGPAACRSARPLVAVGAGARGLGRRRRPGRRLEVGRPAGVAARRSSRSACAADRPSPSPCTCNSVPAFVDAGSSHWAAVSVRPLSCVLRAMSPSMNDTAWSAKSLVEGGHRTRPARAVAADEHGQRGATERLRACAARR